MKTINSKRLTLAESLKKTLTALIPNILESDSLVINFRDPTYSPESGGYHPVEIMLKKSTENSWDLAYVTDFCFVGQGDFTELAKCMDFDLEQDVYQDLYTCTNLSAGIEVFGLWQRNFVQYLLMDVYDTEISFI